MEGATTPAPTVDSTTPAPAVVPAPVSAPIEQPAPVAADPAVRFRGLGTNFRAKLIGVDDVPDSRGDQMCQESLLKLKAAVLATGRHKQKIVINVSLEGIKIVDVLSGEVQHVHPVHRISFIARDLTDRRAFGYIYGAGEGRHQFFGIKTARVAETLVLALRDLFQVVYEMKKKEIEEAKGITVVQGSVTQSAPPPAAAPAAQNQHAVAQNVQVHEPGKDEGSIFNLEQQLTNIQEGINNIDAIGPWPQELPTSPDTPGDMSGDLFGIANLSDISSLSSDFSAASNIIFDNGNVHTKFERTGSSRSSVSCQGHDNPHIKTPTSGRHPISPLNSTENKLAVAESIPPIVEDMSKNSSRKSSAKSRSGKGITKTASFFSRNKKSKPVVVKNKKSDSKEKKKQSIKSRLSKDSQKSLDKNSSIDKFGSSSSVNSVKSCSYPAQLNRSSGKSPSHHSIADFPRTSPTADTINKNDKKIEAQNLPVTHSKSADFTAVFPTETSSGKSTKEEQGWPGVDGNTTEFQAVFPTEPTSSTQNKKNDEEIWPGADVQGTDFQAVFSPESSKSDTEVQSWTDVEVKGADFKATFPSEPDDNKSHKEFDWHIEDAKSNGFVTEFSEPEVVNGEDLFKRDAFVTSEKSTGNDNIDPFTGQAMSELESTGSCFDDTSWFDASRNNDSDHNQSPSQPFVEDFFADPFSSNSPFDGQDPFINSEAEDPFSVPMEMSRIAGEDFVKEKVTQPPDEISENYDDDDDKDSLTPPVASVPPAIPPRLPPRPPRKLSSDMSDCPDDPPPPCPDVPPPPIPQLVDDDVPPFVLPSNDAPAIPKRVSKPTTEHGIGNSQVVVA